MFKLKLFPNEAFKPSSRLFTTAILISFIFSLKKASKLPTESEPMKPELWNALHPPTRPTSSSPKDHTHTPHPKANKSKSLTPLMTTVALLPRELISQPHVRFSRITKNLFVNRKISVLSSNPSCHPKSSWLHLEHPRIAKTKVNGF